MATFTPSTSSQRFKTNQRLFRQMSFSTGISVLKKDGFYTAVSNPSSEAVEAADIAYLGGRVYPISVDEAAALVAAGYEVSE